jgi:protein-S-isoprenylcysteine O-methyltransferase Ste14
MAVVRGIVQTVFFALLLFVPAGTPAWPQGWAFFVLFCVCNLGIGLWLMKTNPALLAARMKSPLSREQKPRDRAVIGAFLISFCAWIAFMGIDARRFGWSHVPLWAEALGAVLILVAYWGWVAVLAANNYAATTIEIQPGQIVASTGPYAVVRHPMYAYALLFMIGMPLMLGSLWGVIAIVAGLPLLVARTLGEESLLLDGLPGYREYAAKVRYRLVPGVW